MTKRICPAELCTGCGACSAICPKSCIEMRMEESGFWYPSIKRELCVKCGKCQEVCPIVNGSENTVSMNEMCSFAAKSKDDCSREKSSSGGIFLLLAKQIIKNGGVVVAPAYTADFRKVEHIVVEDESELERLQGSKYIQSDMKGVFKTVENILQTGRSVFFSGTPCQIASIKKFLKTDYPNLYTQSVICHGIPSPMIWNKYVDILENKQRKKIKKINFRDKSKGWKSYHIHVTFDSGKHKWMKQKDCEYFRAFVQNLILRRSCFQCQYKGEKDCSDITLGDFWGIRHFSQEFDDNKGVSLVVIKTKKGYNMWNDLNEDVISMSVDTERAYQKNPSAESSSVKPERYAEFFEKSNHENIIRLINKMCPLTFGEKIKILIPQKVLNMKDIIRIRCGKYIKKQ